MLFILDPCDGETCSNQGTCSVNASDTTDGYSCACNVGYRGNDCEIGKHLFPINVAVNINNHIEVILTDSCNVYIL